MSRKIPLSHEMKTARDMVRFRFARVQAHGTITNTKVQQMLADAKDYVQALEDWQDRIDIEARGAAVDSPVGPEYDAHPNDNE